MHGVSFDHACLHDLLLSAFYLQSIHLGSYELYSMTGCTKPIARY